MAAAVDSNPYEVLGLASRDASEADIRKVQTDTAYKGSMTPERRFSQHAVTTGVPSSLETVPPR